MTLPRRTLLRNVALLIVAPSIVRASSLMPVYPELQFWVYAHERAGWWGTYLRRPPSLGFAQRDARRVEAKYNTEVTVLERPFVWYEAPVSYSI